MTDLGEILNKKSVNKAEISRRTGINPSRLSELCLKRTARLTAKELYLIALAIDEKPGILLNQVCKDYQLKIG